MSRKFSQCIEATVGGGSSGVERIGSNHSGSLIPTARTNATINISSILVFDGDRIGCHTVRQLVEVSVRILTLNNLSKNFREHALCGGFVESDRGDKEQVNNVLLVYKVDTAIQFTADTIVPESASEPMKRYRGTCVLRELNWNAA